MYHQILRRIDGAAARFGMSRPMTWEEGRRVLSITFDDFPASAATNGVGVLDAFGCRATFYTCLGLLDAASPSGILASPAQVISLHEAGHEIGCHTHKHLDCRDHSQSTILQSMDANSRLAIQLGLPSPSSFAYPFGSVSYLKRDAVSARFQTVRSVRPGINRKSFDAGQLRSAPLMMRYGAEATLGLLRELRDSDGWLIVYTHDVSGSPSAWGCTEQQLATVCDQAREAGIELLPVGDVLA